MRRVVATDFGIWPSFGDFASVSDRMVAEASYRASLANYLLLYDQMIIPTGNFQIVAVLRLVLGDDVFEELLKSKQLLFVRYDHWFGYMGGTGITAYNLQPAPEYPERTHNIAYAYFQPTEQAIANALANTLPTTQRGERRRLARLIAKNVIELPAEEAIKTITDEAKKDVIGSPYLSELMMKDVVEGRFDDFGKKRGHADRGFQIFNPHLNEGNPQIKSFLEVAFENFILEIGRLTEADDLTGDNSTMSILRAKGQRFGFALEGSNAFTTIQELHKIPNIGYAFAEAVLSPRQIMSLRNSKHTQALRDWMTQSAPSELADEIVHRYIATIGKPSLIESLPAKILRYGVTTVSGVEAIPGGGAATGIAVSALDSFVLGSLFNRTSPKLFLKNAKTLIEKEKRMRVPPPDMKIRLFS